MKRLFVGVLTVIMIIQIFAFTAYAETDLNSKAITKDVLMNNPDYAFATIKGGEIEVDEENSIVKFKNVTVYKSGYTDTNTYLIDGDSYIFESPEEFPVIEDFINGTASWITIIVPVEKNVHIANIHNETIHVDGVWGFSKNVVGYSAVVTDTYDENSELIADLKGLGVLNGDSDGSLNLYSYITRAEFMKLVAEISGFSADEDYGEHFADVPREHWAYQYIGFCRSNGLIQGTVSSADIASGKEPMFNPDEFIQVEDAMKVVLDLTGYLISSDINRTYADTASEIGLIDYMEIFNEKYLIRGNAATVIYNAMHIPIMDINSVATDETLYTKYFGEQ